MSLRILHILDHSLPLHSGYVFRTLSILREQRRLGWETFHVTSPKQGECASPEETVDGWHFYRTTEAPGAGAGIPALGEFELMRRLSRRIGEVAEKVRPHILHAHSPLLNALPAQWVGRRLGIPVVYELRALWEDAAVDHGTTVEGSLRYRASRWLDTIALRRADHVTTICEGLRGEIASRGIPASKITVIPNAVDPETFHTDGQRDPDLARRLGLEDCAVLGFAGSFYAYEGLDLLVDALGKLLSRGPKVKLLLVGGGFQEAALKGQVQSLGLENHVIFTGRVPHDQVQRYYDLVDVLVYPRRAMRLTDLVTPLKPLEAMAQGRLVVASDCGGHREMVFDGKNGLLFPAGNADALAATIEQMLSLSAEQRDAMRRAGRLYVEQERTWARSVSHYRDIYARLAPTVSGVAPAAQELAA